MLCENVVFDLNYNILYMAKMYLTRNTRVRLRKVEKLAQKVLTMKKKCGNICKPFEERITSQDAGNLEDDGKKKS